MSKTLLSFPFKPQTSEKCAEVVEAVFLENVPEIGLPDRVQRRIAEQIVDTPALPDVEEHVFNVFSQDRVATVGS